VWLIFSTFLLTILGTLLTRSGVVSSVHAFAKSPIGSWFYVFIVLVFAVCLFTYFLRRDHLKSENKLGALVSRESSFLFNNMILLAACFTILWGTLFPVLTEFVTGSKMTIGAAFYNRVNFPIGLALLLLIGVGPLLAWRSTSLRSIRRNFVLPAILTIATAVVLMFCGVRPWKEEGSASFFALTALSLAVGVVSVIAGEFLRGAKVVRTQTGKNLLQSVVLLTRRNTRRYGGYIVHLGIVVLLIGVAGGAFNQSVEEEMSFGDTLAIGPYTLVCQSITQDSTPNYDTDYALLDVYKHGRRITQLTPERRIYAVGTDHEQASTIVALHSTPEADLYTVYEGIDPDNNKTIIKVFLNPLLGWIWIGVGIVIAGTLIALVPSVGQTRKDGALHGGELVGAGVASLAEGRLE
jgi:cytochrome c-type biogenesis protein CcmF